jgi:mono/diheme cytochrome c family protein
MRKVLKWIGIVIGGLATLVLVAYLGLYVYTEQMLNRRYEFPVEDVFVPTDAASIERGRHLVKGVVLCDDCHGDDLGGQVMADDPMIGRLAAPNLTAGPGGKGQTFTNTDYIRAIRHGVDPDGTGLVVMPASLFYSLSDEDLGAIIAYVKSMPPVDGEQPSVQLGPVGRFFLMQFPEVLSAAAIDHTAPRPAAPAPGVTVEYGQYLASSCATCHGVDMGGGEGEGAGPDLTRGGNWGTWNEADFVRTVRTRVNPDGKELDPELAPVFENIDELTEDELSAIWLYLQSLPPVTAPAEPG